jgi:alkylhydroperoxidase/carboxymuconolactone decarboxylase family protein YurZ
VTTEPAPQSASDAIKAHSAAVYEAFIKMRDTITETGPLPPHMCEVIRCSHFAALGQKEGFLAHGATALKLGASPDELRHAILVTLGNNTNFGRVGHGLMWVDELERKHSSHHG